MCDPETNDLVQATARLVLAMAHVLDAVGAEERARCPAFDLMYKAADSLRDLLASTAHQDAVAIQLPELDDNP